MYSHTLNFSRKEMAMSRLFKYIPVVVTLVTKYLRSPQGKAVFQKVRSSRHRTHNTARTRQRF